MHGEMAGGRLHVVLIIGNKSILIASNIRIAYANFISCCRRTPGPARVGLHGGQLREFSRRQRDPNRRCLNSKGAKRHVT